MKKLIVFAIAILGFTAVSFGQITATVAAATASATILAPITIANGTPLNFGVVGANATTAKTVVLATDNSRTASTATLFTVGAPAAAGVFQITGTPSAAFSITLPAGVTNISGPGTAMTINAIDWVSDLGLTSTMLSNGTKTLKLGATLQVGIAQAPGNYSGTYAVTVAYN